MQGPGGSESPGGRKFKPLFAPLVIGLDGVMHAEQARPTILLQRPANPSLPHSATGEREAGDEVRMPASTPSDPFTFARDVRGTGL
jgi:hypothetical protein